MRKIVLVLFMIVFSFSCFATVDNYANENYKTAGFEYMSTVEVTNVGGISSWEISYYVDEFGDKTENVFVNNKAYIEGKFSNSATNNSDCYALFLVNKNNVEIILYEYDSLYPVTKISSDKAYIKIKTEDGTVYDFGSTIFTSQNRILIENSYSYEHDVETLFKAFVENRYVTMSIQIKNSSINSTSQYVIKIPTNGFEEMYHKAFIGELENTISQEPSEKPEEITKKDSEIYSEAQFESLLERGENLAGALVKITVKEYEPQSYFGYNVIAGKHLNFISSTNPNVKVGQALKVRIRDVTSFLGSWLISYEIVSK